ncbi:hypothetical protein ABG768_022005, partial [Culter alburnus]
LKASKKSPRIAISSSEEVIEDSSTLSDSFLEEVKMKKRKQRNSRGIIHRYLYTPEAFKKEKSMKAVFDAAGADRNTIARAAPCLKSLDRQN